MGLASCVSFGLVDRLKPLAHEQKPFRSSLPTATQTLRTECRHRWMGSRWSWRLHGRATGRHRVPGCSVPPSVGSAQLLLLPLTSACHLTCFLLALTHVHTPLKCVHGLLWHGWVGVFCSVPEAMRCVQRQRATKSRSNYMPSVPQC